MSFLAYKLKLSLHGKKVILYLHFEHYITTFFDLLEQNNSFFSKEHQNFILRRRRFSVISCSMEVHFTQVKFSQIF